MKTVRRAAAMLLPLPVLLAALAAHDARGGWLVYTFDDMPDHFVVGETYEFGFTARAHGLTPMNGLPGDLVATTPQGGYAIGMLSPGDGPGRYRASLTIPAPGAWTLSVFHGVTANRRLPATLAVVDAAAAPRLSARQRGERLFDAKGCVTCHVAGMLPSAPIQRSAPGPNLTGRTFDGDYLRNVLARGSEPSAVGATPARVPGTVMPNLGLRAPEIEALVAFLTGEG